VKHGRSLRHLSLITMKTTGLRQYFEVLGNFMEPSYLFK